MQIKLKFSKDKIVTLAMATIALVALIVLFAIYNKEILYALEKNFIKGENYKELLKGLLNTFLITFVAFIAGIILGIGVCLIEGIKSNNTFCIVLKKLVNIYVAIFRGTPATVQLLIIYFVIFAAYRGDAIYIAMLAFGLNSGAYVSEIIRGGINAVPKGQMEAGRSLGLSYPAVMQKIIFPQAIRNALPSLGNEFIALIKETSIVGFIGAIDLTLAFRKIAGGTYDYMTVYLVMGVIYFVIVFFITLILNKIERKYISNAYNK